MNVLQLLVHSPLQRPGEERCDPSVLAEAYADAGARLVTVDPRGAHVVGPTQGVFDPTATVYLGCSAADVAEADDPGSHHWFARRGAVAGPGLRELALSELMHDVVTTATAVLAWHDRNPVCESCGAVTEPVHGGFVRECSQCGAMLFPRHDPAVIVAVMDRDDRLLLAHQATWPPGRVSVLAGFVEAGETLEQTCGREIREEVGLRVEQVRYVASQPWPFPRSLMVGFVALAEGEPAPDGSEIAWARWFTREELEGELQAGTITIPGPTSLGRGLIEAWLAHTLQPPA